jgi:hypothetical protein
VALQEGILTATLPARHCLDRIKLVTILKPTEDGKWEQEPANEAQFGQRKRPQDNNQLMEGDSNQVENRKDAQQNLEHN